MNGRAFLAACAAGLSAATLVVTGSATFGAAPAAGAVASVPRPDHVVIVVEENKASGTVLGSANAPYINSLAAFGANMTQFFAERHPSQPNYIAMLSGSTQGVTDDSCPQAFTAPNLAGELIASGAGFTGYSEDLPSAGYTGCTSGAYARKHNPWSDFTDVPASANQPLTAFPTDYTQLPAVSFVIPNLNNDMHDGTVAQGDTWLQQHLDGYVTWAKTHNSVLVLTFDEDDNSDGNRIATVIVGQGVIPGDYPESLNHYNLLRTLTDAYGITAPAAAATASPILDIWSDAAGTPRAYFTSSCSGFTCTFDASRSGDANGTITSFQWAFGDGGTATGANVQHTYSGTGPFAVTLTVTDDSNLTSTATQQVSPGSTAPFVRDAFQRTVSTGLGTADVGGAWTTIGTAANFSVSPGAAALALPAAGAQDQAYIGPGQTDADVLATVGADKVPVGGSLYLNVTGRRVASSAYFAKLVIAASGAVTIRVARTASGTETALGGPVTVKGITYAAGAKLAVRVQVTGTSPTQLRARVWPAAQAEPTTWQVSGADTTAALQAAGTVALTAYLSGGATNAPVTARVWGFQASRTSAAPNSPPVAAFTASCTQLTCSFDGSGSSDDKGVTGYAWDFGDGTSGTGATPGHGYGSAGTYPVTLTVRDAEGATNSVTHSVTVAASSAAFATDSFARTVSNGWGTADVGGPWSRGGLASQLAVGPSGGTMTLAKGSQAECYLAGISRTDADVFASFSVDRLPAGGPAYLTVEARRISSGTSYSARVIVGPSGAVTLRISRFAGGAETQLVPAVSVGTVTAGRQVSVRVEATGTAPTQVQARAWLTGTAEPATWQVTASDTTAALQASGSVGVLGYVSSAITNGPVTIAVASFQGRPTG